MKTRTFVIGYVLALALLVFANRRSETGSTSTFRTVVDLTNASPNASLRHKAQSRAGETRIQAPSTYSPKLWSVDQIPGERLVAPLAIIHGSGSSAVSMEDVVHYEQDYGRIPSGAIVMARTQANANFSEDAVKFLVHARNVVGMGVAQETLNSEPDNYALSHSAYLLSNVANLEKVPAAGSMVMVAPSKLHGAATGPVRILALVR